MLGSFKNPLAFNNYLELEKFNHEEHSDFDDFKCNLNTGKNYKIYLFNYENIIIIGQLGIYVINPFNLEIKKEIILNNKLIENAFYLNDSTFLIFLKNNSFIKQFHKTKSENSEILCASNKENNLLVTKIEENSGRIIFETFVNRKGKKVCYDFNIISNIVNENNLFCGFISFLKDISLYQFINIQKKLEMKNN